MASISTSPSANGFKRLATGLAVAAGLTLVAGVSLRSATATFYPDDPIWKDDDTARDASKVVIMDDSGGYDWIVNTFGHLGGRRGARAMNVNTLDEVPDSSWFVNRIGRRDMSLDELRRGTDRVDALSLDGWSISGSKAGGVTPGFRMTDPTGHTYMINSIHRAIPRCHPARR